MQFGPLTDTLENANIDFLLADIGTSEYLNFENIDIKLVQAALQVLQSGSLTPLIKEELKTTIQHRRLTKGKEELKVSFEKAKKYELREDEKERIKKRKEDNRLAAIRFRQKRKNIEKQLSEECERLEERNKNLVKEVESLEEQKSNLLEAISTIRSPP